MTYQIRIMFASLMMVTFTTVAFVAVAEETAPDAAPAASPETAQTPDYTILTPEPDPAPQQALQEQPNRQQQSDPRAAIAQARLAERQARLAEREAIREERLRKKEEARRSGRPLIISGATLLGAGYGASAIVGGMLLDAEADDAAYMFIPIVGSPIFLGSVLSDVDYDGPTFMLSLALITPAIAQVAGIALLATGLVKRSRYKKENAVAISPLIAPGISGFAVSAVF